MKVHIPQNQNVVSCLAVIARYPQSILIFKIIDIPGGRKCRSHAACLEGIGTRWHVFSRHQSGDIKNSFGESSRPNRRVRYNLLVFDRRFNGVPRTPSTTTHRPRLCCLSPYNPSWSGTLFCHLFFLFPILYSFFSFLPSFLPALFFSFLLFSSFLLSVFFFLSFCSCPLTCILVFFFCCFFLFFFSFLFPILYSFSLFIFFFFSLLFVSDDGTFKIGSIQRLIELPQRATQQLVIHLLHRCRWLYIHRDGLSSRSSQRQ